MSVSQPCSPTRFRILNNNWKAAADGSPRYFQLPHSFNYQVRWFSNGHWFYFGDRRLPEGQLPVIIHYTGEHKPWNGLWYIGNPYYWLWHQYRILLPFPYGTEDPVPWYILPAATGLLPLIITTHMPQPRPPKFSNPFSARCWHAFGSVIFIASLWYGSSMVDDLWHPIDCILVMYAWTFLFVAWIWTIIQCVFVLAQRPGCASVQLCAACSLSAGITILISLWRPTIEQPKYLAFLLQVIITSFWVGGLFSPTQNCKVERELGARIGLLRLSCAVNQV
jgi:hypothetical protein